LPLASCHPELEGLNPEDYPDIARMRILSDVAPYSREYQKYASRVRNQVTAADRSAKALGELNEQTRQQATGQDTPALEAGPDRVNAADHSAADRSAESLGELNEQTREAADLKVEYERITEQVRQTKESTLQVAQKHFNAPVDEISGTVDEVSTGGITLNEYPGRTFRFSSVSSSMADLTAEILGRSNRGTDTRCLPGTAHKTPSRAGEDPEALSIPVRVSSQNTLRRAASRQASCSITASGTGWFLAGLR
jgi:hypothetical protein